MNKSPFLLPSHHGDDSFLNLRLPAFLKLQNKMVLFPGLSGDREKDKNSDKDDLKKHDDSPIVSPSKKPADPVDQDGEQAEEEKEEPVIEPSVFDESLILLKGVAEQDGDEIQIQNTRKIVETQISSIIVDNYKAIEGAERESDEAEKSRIRIMLLAANRVLNYVFDELQKATMGDSGQQAEFFILVQMVHQEYTEYIILETIRPWCDSKMHDMNPGDLGNLISWMNYCSERWRQTYPVLSMMSHGSVNSTQSKLQEALLKEYLLRGVREPVREMLKNIVSPVSSSSEQDIVTDENGQLTTYQPLDIQFMLNGQLSVAKNVLPQKHVSHVLATCNDELRAMIGNVMLDIESSWKTIAVVRLCSVINDAAKLSDQCEGHNETHLQGEQHIQEGNDLCTEFIELSLHATRYLCERIFQDLREPEPILTRIGDCEWEEEEMKGSVVVIRTIATLVDYFEDAEEWIPQYYFTKCLKNCFDLTLEMYVDSFFSNSMAKGLLDPQRASSALHHDGLALLSFFGKELAEYHGRAGFYSVQVIQDRLELLSCLSRLLDSDLSPRQLQGDIKMLLQQLGTEPGVPAVLHLAGLRANSVHVEESAAWHVELSRATQQVREEAESTTPPLHHYKIPDLRNSVYLHRVKPIQDRQNDDGAMDATNRLVQRPGLNRNFSFYASFRTPQQNQMDGPMLSHQSRRNLMVQRSERHLGVDKTDKIWKGRGGLSRMRTKRFKRREARKVGDEDIQNDDDSDLTADGNPSIHSEQSNGEKNNRCVHFCLEGM